MPRRALLKSALMVLGASVIIQPGGAVFGLGQDEPKQDNKTNTVKTDTKVKSSHIKGQHSIKYGGQTSAKTQSKTNKTNKATEKDKASIKYGGQSSQK